MKQPISIQVEDKVFNSLSQASKYLGINQGKFSLAIKQGKNEVNGLKFTILSMPIQSPTKKKRKAHNHPQSCPVYCETTGVKYKTIAAASKVAHVDNWVMSLKMSTAGQFVDKDGNVYKRLKPMVSKNVYVNTGDKIKFNRNVTTYTKPVKVEESKPIVNKNELAQKILKEKTIGFINEGHYNLAKDLIDVIAELNKGE